METIKVPPEKKIELLTLCMARDSWNHTREALRSLQALGATPDHAMYDILLTAACVLYIRPFEKSHGLERLHAYAKFDDLDEADTLRKTHKIVDDARNQLMAHQQVSGWTKLLKGVSGALPGDRLVIRMGAGPMSYEVSAPTLEPGFIQHFMRLAAVQEGRANEALFNAAMPVLPSLIEDRKEFQIEAQQTPREPTAVGCS